MAESLPSSAPDTAFPAPRLPHLSVWEGIEERPAAPLFSLADSYKAYHDATISKAAYLQTPEDIRIAEPFIAHTFLTNTIRETTRHPVTLLPDVTVERYLRRVQSVYGVWTHSPLNQFSGAPITHTLAIKAGLQSGKALPQVSAATKLQQELLSKGDEAAQHVSTLLAAYGTVVSTVKIARYYVGH